MLQYHYSSTQSTGTLQQNCTGRRFNDSEEVETVVREGLFMEEGDLTMKEFYKVLPRRDKYVDVLWGHVEKRWYFSGKNHLDLM